MPTRSSLCGASQTADNTVGVVLTAARAFVGTLSRMASDLHTDGAHMRVDLFLFGVPFWNPTYEEFRAWLAERMAVECKAMTTICIANAHTLNIACADPQYAKDLAQGDTVINDGFGYRIGSHLRGFHTNYNFNGTDLIPRLFSEVETPLRVFLYGATEDSNAKAAKKVSDSYPNVQIVGRLHGFVEEDLALEAINACAPDLLLCALGQPKQERFMVRNRKALHVKVQVGVGGLFDFLSGTKPRAPKFVRDFGFEWLYRLAHEPRRLFRRYVIGNPLFLWRCLTYHWHDKRLNAPIKSAAAKLPGQTGS